ncbi:hypothetical protein M569_04688 [Genlisea aurea]|uniref:Fe2OG dioxygenase domain-containing protein n=1 Tax=Genlisea aurea TaxID=192259 RepID=S8EBX2_9LAMI|nr:hypothetical protein M569_04688 [Genlisea aurea]
MYRSDVTGEYLDRTAFRKAEKKYKIYYDHSRKKKLPKPVDLSEVIDFKSILESFSCNVELPEGVSVTKSDLDRHVFCLKSRPGFYFIPNALSTEEQCQWIKESLITFPLPPNRTNHNAIYGPIHDLFASAKEGKFLQFDEKAQEDDGVCLGSNVESVATVWKAADELGALKGDHSRKYISASVLLRKLRWSTLGLQFDWSKRNYDTSLPHRTIPDSLSLLAKRMAAPAMPHGAEFKPEAAIVNYFGLGDMLGGHLDDMEQDWSKPIVSISLGCKAIFLLGGKSREDPPIAMFLRSGDVVLMAGEARECYHGVPRIFLDQEHAEISHLESLFETEDGFPFLNYIRTSRININIRQVF